MPPNSPATDPQSYRAGFREGFRDGFGEAGAQRQREATKKAGAEGEGDDQGDPDTKKDDEKANDEREDDKTDDHGRPPLYKRPFAVAATLLVVLAVLVGAIVFWRHSTHHATTDDAFIDGQAIQVAAQVAGRVTKLHVADNQHVNVGDPLVDIDSRDNDARVAQARGQLAQTEGQVEEAVAQVGVRRAAVAESEANVRQAEAELTKAVQDLARYRDVNPDAVARQQVDAAVSNERTARAKRDSARMSTRSARAQVEAALAQVRSGEAQVAASRANVDAASLQNSYTHVVAPIAGRVARRTVEPGNVINVGQNLMALVGDALWVTANYKETQLTEMKPGQSVEIVVDAYPDVTFRGHVDSIQRATGAYFSMLPAENATGNYVKVVQRVPVKIVFDDDRIHDFVVGPGMSVTPNVALP